MRLPPPLLIYLAAIIKTVGFCFKMAGTFQFQNGTITSKRAALSAMFFMLFQFQNGTITSFLFQVSGQDFCRVSIPKWYDYEANF